MSMFKTVGLFLRIQMFFEILRKFYLFLFCYQKYTTYVFNDDFNYFLIYLYTLLLQLNTMYLLQYLNEKMKLMFIP